MKVNDAIPGFIENDPEVIKLILEHFRLQNEIIKTMTETVFYFPKDSHNPLKDLK